MGENPDLKIYSPGGEYKFEHAVVKVGPENVLYVTIPYKGCTQSVRCVFCGVQEEPNKNLAVDEKLGNLVLGKVRDFIAETSPDTVVLYNGGNILRPKEMYQHTILVDVPRFIAGHPVVKAYELESRADDIVNCRESLNTIKSNLGGKTLRIRLGIEFLDDELLERHKKGLTVEQIKQAVEFLNQQEIPWNGYSLLGGLDMTKDRAIQAALQTGKFVIDGKAFKLSVNGVFLTQRLEQGFKERIYVPDYQDLLTVMKELIKYKQDKNSKILFKIGFEEESSGTITRTPFNSEKYAQPEILARLRGFDKSQNFEDLF